jgi:hypothetical protein
VKALLTITAALEALTGVALGVAPSRAVRLLLGSPLESPARVVIARVLGAALFFLGAACWRARANVRSRAAAGLVVALLLYNIAVVLSLGYARIGPGTSGVGLWPALTLHSVLAVWCVVCLGIAPGNVP